MEDKNEVRQLLEGHNLRDVARETGLHYNTIRFLYHGINRNPTMKTLEKIREYDKNHRG
jgi:hypothetical protein